MALITLEQARDHLQLTSDASNVIEDVVSKMEQASEMVLDRINTTAYWRAISLDWDELTVPKAVQAAMLMVLTHLYEHRGDDPSTEDAMWRAVDSRLSLHKDPVIA